MNSASSMLKSLISRVVKPVLMRPICTTVALCGEKSTGEHDKRLGRIGNTQNDDLGLKGADSKKEGFLHSKKKTSFAASTTGYGAGQRFLRKGESHCRVVLKGLGPGRVNAVKGMAVAGVQVVSITDRTPIIEKGPRPRKIRRI